jgi:hypothetical protein
MRADPAAEAQEFSIRDHAVADEPFADAEQLSDKAVRDAIAV